MGAIPVPAESSPLCPQEPPGRRGHAILPWLLRSWELGAGPMWFNPWDAPSLILYPAGTAVEHEILHPHPEAGGPPEQCGVL